MTDTYIADSFKRLRTYCERENYKGWDPYDGLNSRLIHVIPFLKKSALWRLAVIQCFKRSPINLRRIAKVPKEYNPKGLGLLLQGYCNLIKVVRCEPQFAGLLCTENDLNKRIIELADLLLNLQSKGEYHGSCWGYNFDWQARRLFLFPRYTPTVVVTSFCATALFDAYEIVKDKRYLDVALGAAEFVKQDLQRYKCKEGFLFSYSSLKGNDTVYNASLLGSRLLSYCYKYSGMEEYKDLAEESIKACCNGQREDGAWVYGLLPVQNWVDSFHTGYNLDCLMAYEEQTGDKKYHSYLEKGFEYYINHFFTPNGVPKYYDNKMYPIDIHCPGQLFVTLSRLHKYDEYGEMADKIMSWTINKMQDKKGFFYYQIRRGLNSRISYMRWSNAFMFYSMSYYLLDRNKVKKKSVPL